MIGDSRGLAGLMTEELNAVTVSLQFQDRIKQILDHMTEFLSEVSAPMVSSSGLERTPVPTELKEEAHRGASRHFTIREEWNTTPLARRDAGGHRTQTVELF